VTKILGYRSNICGKEYPPVHNLYTCPRDVGNLDVVLDYTPNHQKYEIEDIVSRSLPPLWRYLQLLHNRVVKQINAPAALGKPYFRGERGY
jgi:hypothetical protein